MIAPSDAWPPLDYHAWRPTCEVLHLWTQIVGKYRLAHTPWLRHSWHATLYVTPRGLTTGLVPDPGGPVVIDLDLQGHRLLVQSSDRTEGFALGPMSVAEFLAGVQQAIRAVGGTPSIHGRPNEVQDPTPFAEDKAARPYDAEAVMRFHRALLRAGDVFGRFASGFLGKVSPVHLFWGSFDLAVTRFSGRAAPRHPGGIPSLPDTITREAYSHELSSAGFWPGGGGADEAMFYSYAYPTPDGFAQRPVRPEAARWDAGLGEFLLPYEAVRKSDDPEGVLMAFLETTYTAAAETGGWDRGGLECGVQRPRVPRPVEEAAP